MARVLRAIEKSNNTMTNSLILSNVPMNLMTNLNVNTFTISPIAYILKCK